MLTGSKTLRDSSEYHVLISVGESVPVTKVSANESMFLLDLAADSISADAAKHFLFGGTKIVRARRPQEDEDDEAVALAIVVRTGFNTTKGALVRSMLFPKPSGFKFYKDAFRYVSVMAGVAGIGFLFSFVNFVQLGVGLCSPFFESRANLCSWHCTLSLSVLWT